MHRLIVGLDGTKASAHALHWAAHTVGRHGALHAVTAIPRSIEFGVDVVTGDRDGYIGFISRDLTTSWTERVRDTVGEFTTDLCEQSIESALTDAAAAYEADGIVVGAHVSHGLVHRVGRTLHHLLHDLPTPLIIVPTASTRRLGDGPIVVGIGHGEATEAAVSWTAGLADDHDVTVGLIRATGDAPVFQSGGVRELLGYYLHPSDRAKFERGDITRLAEVLQATTDREIEIDIDVRSGLPALQLVEASEDASLIVIGQHRSAISRGHRTAQPLRYALTHAACPVAVIPEAAV